MEEKKITYFGLLESRIKEILCLPISEDNRRKTVEAWIYRLLNSLEEDITQNIKLEEDIEKYFSHFVGKTLSIIEGLNLNEKTQKSIRKLILDEIYSCRNAVILIYRNKNV